MLNTVKKLLSVLALGILLFACSHGDTAEFKDFIQDNLKKGKGILNLKAYDKVQWDRLYVLGPYTNDRMLTKDLKHYHAQIMDSGIFTDDDLCLVMLFNGNNLVAQAVFDNNRVNFTALSEFLPNGRYKPTERVKASYPYIKKKVTYIITRF